MKKLEFDLTTMAIRQVQQFTPSSDFVKRFGDCTRLIEYYPNQNSLAITIGEFSLGDKIVDVKIRHSQTFLRTRFDKSSDITFDLYGRDFKGNSIRLGNGYSVTGDEPTISEFEKAWPKSLPKIQEVLLKIAEYFHSNELKNFANEVEKLLLPDLVAA